MEWIVPFKRYLALYLIPLLWISVCYDIDISTCWYRNFLRWISQGKYAADGHLSPSEYSTRSVFYCEQPRLSIFSESVVESWDIDPATHVWRKCHEPDHFLFWISSLTNGALNTITMSLMVMQTMREQRVVDRDLNGSPKACFEERRVPLMISSVYFHIYILIIKLWDLPLIRGLAEGIWQLSVPVDMKRCYNKRYDMHADIGPEGELWLSRNRLTDAIE